MAPEHTFALSKNGNWKHTMINLRAGKKWVAARKKEEEGKNVSYI